MKTFEVRNGDFVVGPGGFATLSGAQKVKQDLSIAVREPYAGDRFHPRWGSVLASFVGEPISEDLQMRIRSEISRLIGNYMAVQQDQVVKASARGDRQKYRTNEIVTDIKSIQIRPRYDRLHVRVVVVIASGDAITLTSTLGL